MSFKKHPDELRLWKLIDNKETSERKRAEAFSELAQGKVNLKDFDQALVLAEEAEKLFADLNDEKNVADAVYTQGNAHFGMKEYTEALGCYQKAASIFRSDTNERFLAFAVDRSADCYTLLHQPNLAAQQYQSAAALFKNIEETNRAIIALLDASDALIALGEYEQAELRAREAEELINEDSSLEIIQRMNGALASALYYQRDYQAAIAHQNTVIMGNLYVALPDTQATAHITQAVYYAAALQYEEAQGHLATARQIAEESGEPQIMAKVDLNQAELAFEMADFELAFELAKKCQGVIRYESIHSAFHVDFLLAKLYRQQGETSVAIEYFEKALESIKKFEERDFEDELVYVEFAQTMLQTPNSARAIELLDELPMIETLKPDEQLRAHNIRARAHYLNNQYERAVEVTDQVFGVTGEDWSNEHYAYALETKARALLDSGDTENGKGCLQHAINVAASQGSPSALYLAQTLREIN